MSAFSELIKDSAFGHLLRLVSGGRILAWPENNDPALIDKYMGNGDDTYASNDALFAKNKEDAEKGSLKSNRRIIQFLPNDPSNPRNWPMWKKFFVTFEICLLTTSVYIGSAIYTAGLGTVIEDFNVSSTAALLGLTLFVAGYGLGPIVWAPLSEMPFFGRTPIYVLTLTVFVFLQFAVIYAENFGMLLAFRFLTGLFGSPALATGGATISDMFSPRKRAYGISVWGIAAVLGPVLGPLIGGFAAENEGWQWTIWELMWLSGFTLVVLFFFLPETSASNILFRRANRLRKLTNQTKDDLKTQDEVDAEQFKPMDLVKMVMIRPITLSIMEPIVLALNLYIALLYALLYLWFESFPIVFEGMYGFSLGTSGVAYVGILVGAFITVPPFWYYLYKYTEPEFNENGEIKPERRLPPACVGGFLIPICMFMFGWSAGRTHWIVPIIGTSFFSVGAFLLFNSVLNYLGDAYPDYAASVYAGNDFMRSAFGASFPLFANAMFNNLGIDWGCSLLGFLSMAFIPIPFILVKYGGTLRMKSKNARHDL